MAPDHAADKKLPRDPLSPIPPSRHPFQFWVLVACLVNGWVVLLKDPKTQFAQTVPKSIVFVFGLLLVTSSTLALVSAWWSDRISGLLMERAALIGLGIGTVVYGGFLFYSYQLLAAQSGSLSIGIGIACAWRCWHINREILVIVRLINSRESE